MLQIVIMSHAREDGLVGACVARVASRAKAQEDEHCSDQNENDRGQPMHGEMDRGEKERRAENEIRALVDREWHEPQKAQLVIRANTIEKENKPQSDGNHAHRIVGKWQ